MTILDQLHAAGVGVFPCYDNKSPAVAKGVDWRDVAKQPPATLHWPSGLFGVPIPPNVVTIDGDWYKGLTPEHLDGYLGGPLPYQAALIQTTPRGGQHFAFRAPDGWAVRQGTNINGHEGLDTRVGGLGFICAGEGYQQHNMGLMALAHPECLPVLPDHCRAVLEAPSAPRLPASPQTASDADTETIRAALCHLNPACGRSEWFRILTALRQHYEHNELEGFTLFNEWSSGDLHGELPHNYVAEHMEHQWYSTKPRREGQSSIAIGTLFYDAMQNGWHPPSTLDVAGAFGANAAPADTFNGLLVRINESGTDLTQTLMLVDEIRMSACNALQRDILTLALKAALKEANVLDKSFGDRLDGLLRVGDAKPPSVAPVLPDIVEVDEIAMRSVSAPSGVHGTNAVQVMNEVFADRIATHDGQLRWWTGREWALMPEPLLDRIIFMALMPDQSKAPNVAGTKAALRAMAPVLGDCASDYKIYYRNAVLDLRDGQLYSHDRRYCNRSTLTVCSPAPVAPVIPAEFGRFVYSLFGESADYEDRCLLLQETIGYLLIQSDLNVQKVVAYDGASRAGKGVILSLIQEILGAGKRGAFSFSDMDNDKVKSSFRQHDVVIDTDAKPTARANSKAVIGFMNKVVSGEPVSVPLLYSQQPWEGVLKTKMVIGCNGIPTMLDDSGATTNRFIALYFDRTFAGREDRGLLNRLRPELQQIADWALEGLKRLVANDGRFTMPATTVEALEQLKEANQPMDTFIDEWLDFGADYKSHVRDLWHAYKMYCTDANISLPSKGAFTRSLKQALLGKDCQYVRALRVSGEVSSGYTGVAVKATDKTNIAQGAFTKV